jgi:hypothetical protein
LLCELCVSAVKERLFTMLLERVSSRAAWCDGAERQLKLTASIREGENLDWRASF